MPQIEEIDVGLLEQCIGMVKTELDKRGVYASLNNKFRDPVLSSSPNQTTFAPSIEIIQSYKAIESCLGSYMALRKTVSDLFKDSDEHLVAFQNTYSLFGGAATALKYLDTLYPGKVPQQEFNLKMNGNLPLEIIQRYAQGMSSQKTNDALGPTKFFVENLCSEALRQKDGYNTLVEKVKHLNFRMPLNKLKPYTHLEDIIINGFDYGITKSEKSVSKTTWDNLVGVDHVAYSLALYGSQVCLYNPQTRLNREKDDIPWIVLLYGNAGTGKTSLIKALSNQMQSYCSELNIPFTFESFKNSDRSKWHGESPQKLRDKMNSVRNPNGVGLFYIDDIDMVINSRENNDYSPIEGQLLNELMNDINGVEKDYIGNALYIFTTNQPDPKFLDYALDSRIKVSLQVDGPRIADDYTRLFQIFFRPKIESGQIGLSESDWSMIGKRCEQYGFVGRDVNNIYTKVNSMMVNKIVPLEVCALPDEQKWAARQKDYRQVGAQTLLSAIENYYKERISRRGFER